MPEDEPFRMPPKSCSETIRLWNCKEFQAFKALAPEKLATSHSVRDALVLCALFNTDKRSAFSQAFNPSADADCYLAYPDFPRLFPLPYQGFQGLYPLAYAKENGGFPARFVFPIAASKDHS